MAQWRNTRQRYSDSKEWCNGVIPAILRPEGMVQWCDTRDTQTRRNGAMVRYQRYSDPEGKWCNGAILRPRKEWLAEAAKELTVVRMRRGLLLLLCSLPRCGNRHQKLGAHYFDGGFFT